MIPMSESFGANVELSITDWTWDTTCSDRDGVVAFRD